MRLLEADAFEVRLEEDSFVSRDVVRVCAVVDFVEQDWGPLGRGEFE